MTDHTFDGLRTTGSDRRRALLAIGATGIAAAFAGTSSTAAKQSAGKKRKKRCKKQKQACTTQVTATCDTAPDPQVCKNAMLPCCATCDLPTAMACATTAAFVAD